MGVSRCCGRRFANGGTLQAVKAELRRRMHRPIGEQGTWLRSVVGGHVRYSGVPMNGPARTATVSGRLKIRHPVKVFVCGTGLSASAARRPSVKIAFGVEPVSFGRSSGNSQRTT
jgi:hypothetical protein